MGAVAVRNMKKSAIGGTSVTLVPDTQESAGGETLPPEFTFTQIVFTTPATPPAGLWGVAVADGRRYRITVEEYT